MRLTAGMGLGLSALLMLSACNGESRGYQSPEYSDSITHEQGWAHEDATNQANREWDQAHGGYSGSFACHTKDGGCFAMACNTKQSCDYLQTAQKQCAMPDPTLDPKVLERLVVADEKCAPEQPAQPAPIVTTGGTVTYANGGWYVQH